MLFGNVQRCLLCLGERVAMEGFHHVIQKLAEWAAVICCTAGTHACKCIAWFFSILSCYAGKLLVEAKKGYRENLSAISGVDPFILEDGKHSEPLEVPEFGLTGVHTARRD